MIKKRYDDALKINLWMLTLVAKKTFIEDAIETVLFLYVARFCKKTSFDQLETKILRSFDNSFSLLRNRLRDAYPGREIDSVEKIDINKLFCDHPEDLHKKTTKNKKN